MSKLRYWVPLGRDNIPNWSRAVPEMHPPPKLRARDQTLLLTEHVPDHLRSKWENTPKENPGTP